MSDAPVALRDVPGPSALGGGWRRALELLYLIAALDFKRHYFGTALGYVWSIARPLMLFAVLLAVFTQVFRLGSEVPNYPVLLLLNIVLFSFFQEATGVAVTSIVGQEGVVRKTQFPRLVIPLAVVLTGLFTLGLNLIVVLVFLLAFGVTPAWTWLLAPAAARGADHPHDGGVDDRLVAVPALPRPGDHLDRALDDPLLREPGAVPAREGAGHAARHRAAQPARDAARARAQVDRRSDRARPRGARRRLGGPVAGARDLRRDVRRAVWVFNREAPRIAEAL